MKTFLFFLGALLFTSANASELSALERAVEVEFARVDRVYGVIFEDQQEGCDVLAEVLVDGQMGSARGPSRVYECSVCLSGDDNGLYDAYVLSCDRAQD